MLKLTSKLSQIVSCHNCKLGLLNSESTYSSNTGRHQRRDSQCSRIQWDQLNMTFVMKLHKNSSQFRNSVGYRLRLRNVRCKSKQLNNSSLNSQLNGAIVAPTVDKLGGTTCCWNSYIVIKVNNLISNFRPKSFCGTSNSRTMYDTELENNIQSYFKS